MTGYHRPASLDEALSLLAGDRRVVLAGGTVVNGARRQTAELVDIQALELDGISDAGETVVIGATTRLGDIASSDLVPDLIGRLARTELGSTLRNLATVGGTIATRGPDSALVAGLLVHDAEVSIVSTDGTSVVPLGDLIEDAVAGSIITSIEIASNGAAAQARTSRTPADAPIVSVVGRRRGHGEVVMAATGVAPTPVLIDPADPTAGLAPEGDFRGSAEYRLELVRVLASRVLESF